MIIIYKISEPLKISTLNTFRDNAPFFQQQKKNKFLKKFLVLQQEKNVIECSRRDSNPSGWLTLDCRYQFLLIPLTHERPE